MNKKRLQQFLIVWYHAHKRDLPWRQTRSPYRIWLSEIILQQTRVAQGLPYYLRFLSAFPTVNHLAEASQDQVLKLWEGLGYYSRARNMHAAAQVIANEYNGLFPDNYKDLLKLKGVGDYTASAIASFAFGEPKAVLDGNVFRVLSRIFGVATPINTSKGTKQFKALADEFLNLKEPALHNQAIMEFGALHCTPKNPACGQCAFSDSCVAFSENKVKDFPVKEPKTYNKVRHITFLHVTCQGQVAVIKRTASIWQGLYQFPMLEYEETKPVDKIINFEDFEKLEMEQPTLKAIRTLPIHKLTHQTLHLQILPIEIKSKSLKASGLEWVPETKLRELAFPKPLRHYLDQKQLNLPL